MPIYSPGVPMLMALFKIAGGDRAVYYVVPLLGGLAVWVTFLVGRQVAGPVVGAAAAVLLFISIFFPYWKITLFAPQYPQGLTASMYVNRLTGTFRRSTVSTTI